MSKLCMKYEGDKAIQVYSVWANIVTLACFGTFLHGLKWSLTAKPREFSESSGSENYLQWEAEYYQRVHPWLTPMQWDDMLDQMGKNCENKQDRYFNGYDADSKKEQGQLYDDNRCYDEIYYFLELYYEGTDSTGADVYRLPWGQGVWCTLLAGGWFMMYFIRARAIVCAFGED